MRLEFAVKGECLTGGVPAGKKGSPCRFHVPCTWGKPLILPSPSLLLLSHGAQMSMK